MRAKARRHGYNRGMAVERDEPTPAGRAGDSGPTASRPAPLRLLAIGALLVLIGVLLGALLAEGRAPVDVTSYRRIEGLAYERALVVRARGPNSIHLETADGSRFRFGAVYWPDGWSERDLAEALRADSVATVWVSKGRGYPSIKGIETSRLSVDPAPAVVIDRRRRTFALVFAPAAVLLGALLLILGARRLRARPPPR